VIDPNVGREEALRKTVSVPRKPYRSTSNPALRPPETVPMEAAK
jgi:hypothetical protein